MISLYQAIMHKDLDVVKLKVELGSDVNSLAPDDNYSLLQTACMFSTVEIIKYLIAKGANIHYIDRASGQNLLHCACKGHDDKVINYVKMLGFDLKAPADKSGRSPNDILFTCNLNNDELLESVI